jgi:ABC-type multidrug transport system ATPase subunit
MGPTGSGKTTLMDMIATVKTLPFSGSVSVNGHPVINHGNVPQKINLLQEEIVAYKRVVGYVQQEDIANGLCTVKETLMFCAKLKPPRGSEEEKYRLKSSGLDVENDQDIVEESFWTQDDDGELQMERRPAGANGLMYAENGRYLLSEAGANEVIGKKLVYVIMQELGLDQVKDSFIGNAEVRGISGGQKKRVSIARTLVSNPYLVFLDEPTSGLSAADAVTLIEQVKNLVDGLGIVAVSVIHQPRNRLFKLFDNLILLSEGKMVYQGPPKKEAAAYFESVNVAFALPKNTNPADHYIDFITRSNNEKGLDEFHAFFKESDAKVIGCSAWVDSEVDKYRNNEGKSVTEMQRELCEGQMGTWQCMKVLGGRELEIYPRDQIRFSARIFNAMFMGLMLGFIYADIDAQNLSAFAMVGIEMPVIQSVATLPCLFRDRQFFHLESESGLYTTTPFYLTTYFFSIIFSAITVFLQIVITYAFTQLPWWPFFPLTYIACLAGFFMMDAVIFVICYAGKDLDSAFLYFNFSLGIFMFANGFTMNKVTSGDYINWLLYTSPIFYAMSSVLNAFIHFGDYSDADVVEKIYTCEEGSGCLGLSHNNTYFRNIFIMLAMGLVFHVCAFYCCQTMHRPQR